MRFLKIFLYLIVALVIAYVLFCFLGPKDFNVSRTTSIDASPEAVFEELSDLRKWSSWSPWEKRDTNMIKSFDGTPATVGQIQTWESESQGSGTQSIVELRPDAFLRTELRFKGWDDANYSNFILTPEGEGTSVTWTMEGSDLPFFLRGLIYVMGGKKMIEKDYEEGLASLKTIAEAKPKAPAFELTEIDNMLYVGKRMQIAISDLTSEVYGAAFEEIMKAIGDEKLIAGMPMAVNHDFNRETNRIDMEIAIPVSKGIKTPKGLTIGMIPGGRCAKLVYTGPYEGIGSQWEALFPAVMKKHTPRFASYEVYANDPGTPGISPDQYETWLMIPVQ